MRLVPRQTILAAAVIFVASLMRVVLNGQAAAQAKPMIVDDVFKNVTALKGLSVDDFMLTMGIISAAIGSDCVGVPSLVPAPTKSIGRSTRRERAPRGGWCRW